MAIIRVTFSCYYDYDIEVDNEVYEEDPVRAEDEAIEKAYYKFHTMDRIPITDVYYDEVKVEVQ